MSESVKSALDKLGGFRYVILVAAAGLLLLLWPSGSSGTEESGHEEELRIAQLLTQIEGVGDARVLLSDSGAVIVCRGAGSASVCLRATRAVCCYTGLGADRVQIFLME